MIKEYSKTNKDKSLKGNQYEKDLYSIIRKKSDVLKIHKLSRQKKFYYKQNKPEEIIANIINNSSKIFTEETLNKEIDKLIKNFIKENKGQLIRSDKKYFKKSDISFVTNEKYVVNGRLENVRIIIDTTTSARGDRIKAKAQDAIIYKSFNFPCIYLCVMPNDQYFVDRKYQKPLQEAKNCKTCIYDHNFNNLFKEEGVDLILQEDDLIDFITYISKRKEQPIEKLITNWKNKYFSDMLEQRLKEEYDFSLVLKENVSNLIKKSKIKKSKHS